MKHHVFYVAALSLMILFTPDLVNAQHCPSGVPLRDHNMVDGPPTNSHVIGYAEARGNLPDPMNNSRRYGKKSKVKSGSAKAAIRTFKVFVMEKDGDCYKVANSDLGKTMKVHSKGTQLDTEAHYELRLRKLQKTGTEAEAPEGGPCDADWEVVGSQKR